MPLWKQRSGEEAKPSDVHTVGHETPKEVLPNALRLDCGHPLRNAAWVAVACSGLMHGGRLHRRPLPMNKTIRAVISDDMQLQNSRYNNSIFVECDGCCSQCE